MMKRIPCVLLALLLLCSVAVSCMQITILQEPSLSEDGGASSREQDAGEGGDFEGINAYLPRTDNELDEMFQFHGETRKLISNLWSKVKIAASNVNN